LPSSEIGKFTLLHTLPRCPSARPFAERPVVASLKILEEKPLRDAAPESRPDARRVGRRLSFSAIGHEKKKARRGERARAAERRESRSVNNARESIAARGERRLDSPT